MSTTGPLERTFTDWTYTAGSRTFSLNSLCPLSAVSTQAGISEEMSRSARTCAQSHAHVDLLLVVKHLSELDYVRMVQLLQHVHLNGLGTHKLDLLSTGHK